MKYTIDAKGKALGRVASEAAVALMGKRSPSFRKNVVAPVSVHVTNASKLKITAKKRSETVFKKHSGYRGGLKSKSFVEFLDQKGYGELVRKTVYGMLPTNKLRSRMIKNLSVTE